MHKYTVGIAGEDLAAEYLEGLGFTITERRFHSGHLETDIIAQNSEYILFTEVKTRRAFPDAPHPYGTPASAVTAKKADNLVAAAEDYLRHRKEETAGLQPRIDVIEIYLDPESETPKVLQLNHYKNAVKKRRRQAVK